MDACRSIRLVHIDPIGTVVLPLLMLFHGLSTLRATLSHFIVGWAKPVPVNPQNLRNKDSTTSS